MNLWARSFSTTFKACYSFKFQRFLLLLFYQLLMHNSALFIFYILNVFCSFSMPTLIDSLPCRAVVRSADACHDRSRSYIQFNWSYSQLDSLVKFSAAIRLIIVFSWECKCIDLFLIGNSFSMY